MNIHAQNYEIGRITIPELEEKIHPIDSAAPVAILFKKGSAFFTFTIDVRDNN